MINLLFRILFSVLLKSPHITGSLNSGVNEAFSSKLNQITRIVIIHFIIHSIKHVNQNYISEQLLFTHLF